MNKNQRINLKVTSKFKNELVREAYHLGFTKGKGVPNFSRYCRWILREGNRPIDRRYYQELRDISLHIMKLGSLFNQNQFHSNRELKIMNENGNHDQSNKGVIKRLEDNIEISENMMIDILAMKKIMMKILIIENA